MQSLNNKITCPFHDQEILCFKLGTFLYKLQSDLTK
ncbi:hypothetical protein pb186bvf_001434 [Paramecium bursaria]